jgi:hypothetical protein
MDTVKALNTEMRDVDDKLIFETSENLEVYPTFEKMGLKDELLMGNFWSITINRVLQSWLRKTLGYPTESNRSHNRIEGCHSTESVGYRQDRSFLLRLLANHRNL